MLSLAIGLFVIAAVFGLILLIAILRNQTTPKPVVFIHGGFAVMALLLVILFIIRNNGEGPMVSLGLFILAALGGLILFSIDIRNKPVPKWLAIVHPIAAALGLLTLIFYVMNK